MAMISCSYVSNYYYSNVPLGAEHVRSRLWLERRIIYSSEVGLVLMRVAGGPADAVWQASELPTPLLVENGIWKTTVTTDLVWPANTTTMSISMLEPGRSQICRPREFKGAPWMFISMFLVPILGAYEREDTLRVAALKYRSAPDTDWALCPIR